MLAVELFRKLNSLGVVLSIDGSGRLAYDAPGDALGDDLLAEMRGHRDELVAVVELFEERAAIMEHDGKLARGDAERLALDDLSGDPHEQSVTLSRQQTIEPIPGVICPWCNRGDRLIDSDAELNCDRCDRAAFRWLNDGSIVRVDRQRLVIEFDC